jgi:hypothetical protein
MRAKKQSTPSKKPPVPAKPPTDAELRAVLGKAEAVWSAIVRAIEEKFAPLDKEWKPSKLGFGRVCLLRHKKRTLLYLIPDKGLIVVAVVLGERAYELAMAASLPAAIKKMFSEAKPYAEGRGIRFPVNSLSEVPVIAKLVEIKTTPK